VKHQSGSLLEYALDLFANIILGKKGFTGTNKHSSLVCLFVGDELKRFMALTTDHLVLPGLHLCQVRLQDRHPGLNAFITSSANNAST
jgi:hypothetical protein